MKKQKNLDELYRERLLGKEVPPPEDAWSNIMSQLPAKQPERSIFLPFWYKIAGVAAALMIAATLALDYFVSPDLFNTERSIPALTSEDRKEQTEEKTIEPYEEQKQEPVRQPEGIIVKNRSAKKAKKLIPFPTHNAIASKVTKDEENIDNESGVLPSSEIADQNPTKSLTENTPEEITADAIASEENTADAILSEELIQDPEREHTEIEAGKMAEIRLRLSTKVAPLFTNGSSSGEQGSQGNSIAYGVSVSYKISDKIAIRSGVNKMEISRNAPTVTYAGGVQANSVAGNANTTLAAPTVDVAGSNSSFYELPLEMEYTLIDKKLQLHLLGGSSLLFLEDTAFPMRNMPAGAPENKAEEQKLHYTGNLGIGLGYRLFKNIEVNLEPTVKVRLGSSENLSPYYLGIYSGFSYRF
ncbi:hypothetical protein [Salinimicrobium sp. HB62]|uniref:hypothetical protein n=1 Tax=Salinimicrobium sp. HB62 TaxID=3077781 RepID=UPI002D7A3A6E|nr:hypothetical protein [Salinimicrobium sp. HB62]